MAAAGLWTTASDLAKFVIEVQRSAGGKSARILKTHTARMMLTPVKGNYGLGLSVLGHPDAPYFFHDGSNAGYKATMVGYPGSGDGVVVLTNGDQGYELGQKIVRAVAVTYHWPDLHPVDLQAVNVSADQVAPYVGTFEIPDVGSFEVRSHGDGLELELWKGVVDPLYSEGPGRLFITSHDLVLTFDGPNRGAIQMDDFKSKFTRLKK